MKRNSLGILATGVFVVALAAGAGAATLPFTGTLSLQVADWLPVYTIPGTGVAQGNGSGGAGHLGSLALAGGSFGPASASLWFNNYSVQSVRFTNLSNLGGSFLDLSGGPPGGGSMGLSGLAKICLNFDPSCLYVAVPVPLAPTTGGAGFGIGGTAAFPGPVQVTMQNSAWTLGQPALTLHHSLSTVTTPQLPGGFAHGPATATSSTAQPSGVVQLVTVTRAFTSLTDAFPELPIIGVLTLHFVPEPGTLLLLGAGATALALCGTSRHRRR